MDRTHAIEPGLQQRGPMRRRPALRARRQVVRNLLVLVACLFTALPLDTSRAAGGGVAALPLPGIGNVPELATVPPFVPAQHFTASPGDIKGFTAIGFVQDATVGNSYCPDLPSSQWGGTAVINSVSIIIPCNTVLQMPAATFTWADVFDPGKFHTTSRIPTRLALAPSGATFDGGSFAFPSNEIRIEGNIVGGQHIAGLVYISQQSLNSGTGIIKSFDHANGVMLIGPSLDGPVQTRLQLNDPIGRFSAGQSADTRFSVDSDNPTIKAVTGYPMCVPRTDPAIADDPLCPQRNRPLVGNGCRNFAAAGVALPAGRELAPPAPSTRFCSAFVMDDPATAGDGDPTSTQQAPFEIGDLITFSGTLLRGDGQGPGGSDTISVHTISANVGIFTQPGTLPVYIALGEFGVSAEAPRVFNQVQQEAPNRIFLEASVTDVTSIVDAYLVDIDPVTGKDTQRWITPWSMTGGIGGIASNGLFVDGGITTQFTGPKPGRVRMRATRSTPGILASPTRYLRVVVRSLCDPVNVNGTAPLLGNNPATSVDCLKRAPAANNLYSGQYLAPNFGFIFPENLIPGDPPVPYNLWALGFLVNGEGPNTGRLMPTPW